MFDNASRITCASLTSLVSIGLGKEVGPTGKIVYEGEWINDRRIDEIEQQSDKQQHRKKHHHHHPQPQAPLMVHDEDSNHDDCGKPTPCAKPFEIDVPIETIVGHKILDAQGNPGDYTGMVLQETKQPHGVGRMVYADGNRIHEGFWKDGKKEGTSLAALSHNSNNAVHGSNCL
jgi:hypothetical protein